ncbi:MAG: ribosomal protein L11 methyltransferase [Leptospiraceae bacterium]|nr:MAG: ribosomal protein L11 methyltransferase [Leptospiraceae bacterium]
MSQQVAIYQEIEVVIPEEYFHLLNEYLEIYDIDNLIGYYEVLYDELNSNNKKKKIIFYFPVDDEKARWEIEALLLSLDIKDYIIEDHTIQSRNYWEDYKNSFQPFMISNHFYLIPIWHKDQVQLKENIIPLYIEPGMAFGTGLHPSTQLMVEWIDKNDFNNKIVLDAGCGSGILSIAALKKGAKLVIAFDIDINAIESTKKNLTFNNLEHKIDKEIFLYQCSWNDPEINRTYHIILANLTLPVFLKYQFYIKNIKTDILVISGIGIEQVQDIEKIFENYNKSLVLEKKEWALIELRKK